MTENTSNNFQQNDALINAYSIQEISSIFGDIDNKILALHNCSSDDFLTLNAYFKKYYADSKNISENAKNLFEIITHIENKNYLFKQLDDFQKCLQDLFLQYENYQDQIISTFDKMIQEMDQMFVTANNLKQDLMTLKLLVANLKLDISISPSSSERMARKANDFNELIIQTKSFFVEFFKNSNVFKNLLKSTNSQLILYRDRNVQNSNDLLAEIRYSSALLDNKYEEATQLVPKLTESTQSTSSSIAKIITNLQYQDIIRQKIDHIQQTHKEILKELKEIKEDDNDQAKLELRLKYYIQIRDIAGLQSSQLIHTNKEYQKAIEIITSKFLEVGRDMNQISELCHLISGSTSNKKYSHFDEIREKFEKSSFLTELIEKSILFSKEKISIANDQFNEIYNNYLELSDFVKTIDKSIHRSIDNQLSSNSDQFESTIKQIQNILLEIQSINNQYQSQFEEIKQLNYNISITNELQTKKTATLENALTSFSEHYELLSSLLNGTNDQIYKIISENQLLSTRISDDIKTSIGQIKYYDYFDKVIEEIIIKLNEINLKLQNIEGTESDDSNKNMDHMRERYTMQSEHIIHDTISGHNKIDLEHLGSTGIEEDDDNLELF
jgi:hypothetical protein